MTTYSVTTFVYWRFPDLTPVVCEQRPYTTPYPTGGVGSRKISDDGTVILGMSFTSTYTDTKAAKWVNGAITVFDPVLLGYFRDAPRYAWPWQLSADGQIMLGWPDTGFGYGVWTGGGTASYIPTVEPGGGLASWPEDIRYRSISADGRVYVGVQVMTYATYWLDGVPHGLTSNLYEYAQAWGISADGSTITGEAFNAAISRAGYWRRSDGIWRPTNAEIWLRQVNANGTVIWSDYSSQAGCYTDNLNSVTGGLYGTRHDVVPLAAASSNSQYQSFFAEDTFSPNPVSAGGCTVPDAALGYTVGRAIKVVGTVTTLLPLPAPYHYSRITGMSGNGNIISGIVTDPAAGGAWMPCYWDASLNLHILAAPAGWAVQGTEGVSRDGSTIYGTISQSVTVEDPPPEPVPNALRLVGLEPQALPDNRYALFSDTGNDFPATFPQYSLSIWCCEDVEVRWPDTDPPNGLLTITPAGLHAEFRAADGTLLFSGVFNNPNSVPSGPPVAYKISFAIDTQTQTVTCWGDNTNWPLASGAFGAPGEIGNAVPA